jgi:hypothetical protein
VRHAGRPAVEAKLRFPGKLELAYRNIVEA